MMVRNDTPEADPEHESSEHGSTRREFIKSSTLTAGGLALGAAYTSPKISSIKVSKKLKPSGRKKKEKDKERGKKKKDKGKKRK